MIETVTYQEGRDVIDALGGLVYASHLAKRWDLTRERVRQLARDRRDFPVPAVIIHGAAGDEPVTLWWGEECDEWWATPRPPGRPVGS